MANSAIGSKFDDFLKEDGIYDEVKALTIKRLIAVQIEQAMDEKHISKYEMAKKMQTSRASLDRLLDPHNLSLTLRTIIKALRILEKDLTFQVITPENRNNLKTG